MDTHLWADSFAVVVRQLSLKPDGRDPRALAKMIRPPVLKAVFSAVISVTAATVLAYQHPDHDELPDIDKRRPANVPAAAVVAKDELAANLGKRVRGLKVNMDRVTG